MLRLVPCAAVVALFTRAHDRVLQAGLAQLNDPAPTARRAANRACQAALDDLTRRARIAA